MQLGYRLAAALRGSWRRSPPALEISAGELAEISPLIIAAGGSGLVWSRLRGSPVRDCPASRDLQHAYRLNSIYAALRERDTLEAVRRLRAHGIDPVIVKGWAAGRLYPQKGFRPAGDVDLCIPPDRFAEAEAVLAAWEHKSTDFDLHPGYPKLYDRTWAELQARTHLVPLDDDEVRVLGAEDHLRLVCFHALLHGLWRALWLCDIAVSVESRPDGFDWDRCLRTERRYRDWVPTCVALTHRLLGVELVGTPLAAAAERLPSWLAPAVVRQWARGTGASQFGRYASAVTKDPLELVSQLRVRWRNPIQATVELNAPFNRMPRLPLQVIATLARAPVFFRGLTPAVEKRSEPQDVKG